LKIYEKKPANLYTKYKKERRQNFNCIY